MKNRNMIQCPSFRFGPCLGTILITCKMIGRDAVLGVLFLLFSNLGTCCSANSSASCCIGNSSSNVVGRLFENYDKALRPNHGGPPDTVFVNIFIGSFDSIQETNMEYKIYGFLRQYWKDERLANKTRERVILTGSEINNLWKPDPFCDNGKASNLKQSDESIDSVVNVYPDGNIMYSRLFIITAGCNMDLRKFPMDEQRCNLKISSYSYTTDYIQFKWQTKSAVVVNSKDLAQFQMTSLQLSNTTDKYVTGDFASIIVTFTFQRRLGYFLIQVYAPDVFVVMLSWIVFWMDRDDMGNRMALGITIILTIMFLLSSINATMPRVSYPKALDWYLMVSFTFVFFSLVECIFVYCIGSAKKQEKEQPGKNFNNHDDHSLPNQIKLVRKRTLDMGPIHNANAKNSMSLTSLESVEDNSNGNTVDMNNKTRINTRKRYYKKIRFDAGMIDTASRIVFPLGFLFYNVAYWYTYVI